jgi:predicted metal-dependent enzyme (double-stranded beta helix superfamily)
MWALVGIYGGQEDNQFFRRADSGLAESWLSRRNIVSKGE